MNERGLEFRLDTELYIYIERERPSAMFSRKPQADESEKDKYIQSIERIRKRRGY